jgi:NADPH-dependent 2,4-dienoyl-CoA reductase/sulfur reductase-like enzyme
MRLVVVGGVAAGLSAASRARRVDPSLEIVVLEKGSRISYGACGLPYFIEGSVRTIGELEVYTPEFFERERNVRIRTNAEVVSLRHAQREVVLGSGERVRYDTLVWAAGARPTWRSNDPRVFHLHTDVDAARLDDHLRAQKPATAAVLGGGYIGLEMATALRARGLVVSLYSEAPHFLHWDSPWLTAMVRARLERARVEVHMGAAVRDAAALRQDIVLAATGLTPNVEVPREAGCEVGRSGALAVTDRMETSVRGIFAAGDCCETNHIVSSRPVWIPLGTTANKMGRVAGANAAGRRERFEGIVGTSIVRVAGLAVATAGFSESQARREGFQPVAAKIEARERPKYFRGRPLTVELVADRSTGRLVGAAIAGDDGALARINTVAAALTARMKVEQLASLDLAYAPPYSPVMDPLLVAAGQLLKAL